MPTADQSIEQPSVKERESDLHERKERLKTVVWLWFRTGGREKAKRAYVSYAFVFCILYLHHIPVLSKSRHGVKKSAWLRVTLAPITP